MTPLRQRMLEDMHLRGLSPATQRSYLVLDEHSLEIRHQYVTIWHGPAALVGWPF